jgi:hypothetical protein
MKHLFLFLLAIALITPQQKASAQQTSATAPVAREKLIQFETSLCRGYCPVYKLTFHNDGTLDYVGMSHVEKMGEETVKLTADEFSKLQKALTRANLWQYGAQLPSTVADVPARTFIVFNGDKKHLVKGSSGLPEPVLKLEQLMQDIAESHEIMVKNGLEPKDIRLSGEVLVQFRQDINVENFCAQFMEMKVAPVRRISEENIWFIGFSPSELTEAQFIGILDGMDGVMKVLPSKPEHKKD